MNMFKMFKQFVTEKNIPECKKFINSYVDKVIVYKDHLEVTFKVVFSLKQKNNIYSFNTSVKISIFLKLTKRLLECRWSTDLWELVTNIGEKVCIVISNFFLKYKKP